MSDLTHLDATGAARMVDVGGKAETERVAIATGRITMSAEAAGAIRNGLLKKGDVIAVARIAGIMAAKKTSELIPLCHPLPLTHAGKIRWSRKKMVRPRCHPMTIKFDKSQQLRLRKMKLK